MGRLSTCCALVALLCVAGSLAAMPVDISSISSSSSDDAIQPLPLLEENILVDTSRELLSMHYPPPPPLADFQGSQNRPTIVQAFDVPFNNSELAQNFTNNFGGAVRCSQDGGCSQDSSRKLLSNHLTPSNFATDYLQKLLDATNDGDGVTAEDGVVTVAANGDAVTMSSTLYYPDGTTKAQLDDETSDDLASRDISSWSDSDLETFASQFGISASVADLKALATSTDNFTTDEDPSGGAQGLQASLLMGVAVILSAFLLV